MLFKIGMVCLSFILMLGPAYAAPKNINLLAVNKTHCVKMLNTTQPFILVLAPGDEILDSINTCAKAAKLQGASVSGLGQLIDPTLVYFSPKAHEPPSSTAFKGVYELASLSGNISNNDDQYYTHVHAVLGNEKFQSLAGHLTKAKVGLTAEIVIRPFTLPIKRNIDTQLGFGNILS